MEKSLERVLEQRETLYAIAAQWQRWHQQRFLQLLSNVSHLTDHAHLIDISDKNLRENTVELLQRTSYREGMEEGRDPHRIPVIIEQVRALWEKHPAFSLGRLLIETAVEAGWPQEHMWDLEDTPEEERVAYGDRARGISLQSAIVKKMQEQLSA